MTANENLEIARRIAEDIEELMNGETPSNWNDGEPMGVCEWLEDALDIEVTHSLNGSYLGCRVCICCGGPNIFIDTRKEVVDVYWGFHHADWCISRDFCNELDCIIEDYARDSFCVA